MPAIIVRTGIFTALGFAPLSAEFYESCKGCLRAQPSDDDDDGEDLELQEGAEESTAGSTATAAATFAGKLQAG